MSEDKKQEIPDELIKNQKDILQDYLDWVKKNFWKIIYPSPE